jgi:hypothetical protein
MIEEYPKFGCCSRGAKEEDDAQSKPIDEEKLFPYSKWKNPISHLNKIWTLLVYLII